MAIHQNHMSGPIGSVIMYNRNGTQCSRSKAAKVHQTKNTKKSSSNFSIGSQLSKIIRHSMADICRLNDGTRHSRISGTFLTWLRSTDIHSRPSEFVQLLSAFNINPEKMSTGKWNDHISINRDNNNIEIKISELIPSELMSIPKGNSIIKLTIRSLAVSIEDMKTTTAVNSFSIGHGEMLSSTIFNQSVIASPGSIILTGIAIECFDDHSMQVKWRKGYNPPAWFGYAEWKAF
ncbi:MAG: hypothetical protein ABI402_01555 [Ferruginibacter sp.]